jgi:hypothetical protein
LQSSGQSTLSSSPVTASNAGGLKAQSASRSSDAGLFKTIPVPVVSNSPFNSSLQAASSDLRSDERVGKAYSSYNEELSSTGWNLEGRAKMREYVLSLPMLPPLRQSESCSYLPDPEDLAGVPDGDGEKCAGGEGIGSWQDAEGSGAANHLEESWDDTQSTSPPFAGNGLLGSTAKIIAGLSSRIIGFCI